MKRQIIIKGLYWLLILLFLTLFFGSKWQSPLLAFYFSCLLLPVVIATTFVFNTILVPKYLLKTKYLRFGLYFLYLIIASLWLEMLMALLAFVVLAKTDINIVNLDGISIINLGASLYLIVFVTSFIQLVIQFQKSKVQIEELQNTQKQNAIEYISIRANRKQHPINLNELVYIESLDDMVKIVTKSNELITREKISKLATSLPQNFIRVHRSYIVNLKYVNSFSHQELQVGSTRIPISRSYKKASLEAFEGFGLTNS